MNGTLPENLPITSIQTKSFVGGIEKSFLYDSIAKSAKREDQVDYVQRQAHKIQQKPQEGGGKLRFVLTDKELATINRILDSNFVSIEIVRHKFFSGTWATNILFQNENSFCEYNSGSGEFLVATIVREIEKASNNSIVLIDEPEVSLHPRAQYKLIEYFLDAIKRKHIQMIATTHSEHIVEMLPKEAIICLRKNENKTFVQQNVIPELAFAEIGSPVWNSKRIIVEDDMAQSIVKRVLETSIKNQYIIFDGDQYMEKVPNFYLILEKDKTLSFYRECFQQVVGIRSSTMDWGLDANPEEGRLNEEQEIEQISTYLNFYRTNVCFLPKVIPEDIVYDEEYLKKICGAQLFPNLADARDSKEKLFRIANALSLPIGGIEQLLITQFIIKKGEDYQKISELLHMIAEQH